MGTYGPHRLTIPEPPQAAAGPSDFQRFAASLEGGLYGVALDEADRDTRFADIPLGGLVTSHERLAVWMRVGDNRWFTVAEDTGWVDNGFTASAGWDLGNYQRVRRLNGHVSINVHVVRTGSTITAPNNGNITDQAVVRIPESFAPGNRYFHMIFRATNTSGACRIDNNGLITILDMHSTATIAPETGLLVDATYPAKDL